MTPTLSLPSTFTHDLIQHLAAADQALSQAYPGDPGRRQPVHTAYVGAHLFRADLADRWGSQALEALAEHAPRPADLALAIGLPEDLAEAIYPRVVEKLRREPVEDLRLDFEDGYGNRPDAEEDGHVRAAAEALVEGMEGGGLPPFVGIRIKPFSAELAARAIRTLDLFLTTVVTASGGRLPAGFVVTLPKVKLAAQVTALADLLDRLEAALSLAPGTVRLEYMVETTQALLDVEGRIQLRQLAEAGRGRTSGAHFGTYDYTTALEITAAYQTLDHPACDLAHQLMQVALAGTGVWLSDGSTNVLPVGTTAAVHAAWRLHYGHVRHSLAAGLYQGWDLHPAQLPTRYAAVYAFFLEGLSAASVRLSSFVSQAAQATLAGSVLDDAATGQALLNFFLRAVHCGALAEEEALARTGLTLPELRGRSFTEILRRRRGGTLSNPGGEI
ncbi:MAG TPA: phosphoenolpyruvate kinase [Thermoanaerobaculia bacterium]|jgi:citrate lyase beta subunit|nr:phosphoenolpyruvate kinase [Thermoanaerobaculia bacterium]